MAAAAAPPPQLCPTSWTSGHACTWTAGPGEDQRAEVGGMVTPSSAPPSELLLPPEEVIKGGWSEKIKALGPLL